MKKCWEPITLAVFFRLALVVALSFSGGAHLQAAPHRRPTKTKARKPQPKPRPPTPKSVGAAGLIAVAQHELFLGNYEAAAEYANNAASKAPMLADYAELVRARSLYRMKRYGEIDKPVTQIFNFQPTSPLIGQAAALAVNADLDGDQPKDALQLIRKYFDRIPQPQADLLFAKCFQANGDLAQAAEYYQRVYYNYPVSAEAAEAATTLTQIKPRLGDAYPPAVAAAMLGRAEKMIHYKRPADARIELTAAIPQLGGIQRELAQVRLGEVDFFVGNPRPAFDYLNALKVNDAEADAERIYYLIKCLRREDRNADVKQYLAQLEQQHANSSWRMQAMTEVADQALVQNDSGTASELYRACAAVFGRNPGAARCNWRRAYEAYHAKSAEAPTYLKSFIRSFPDSQDTTDAIYFLGRWYEKAGDNASARALYEALVSHFPNTYFGILGAARLNLAAIKSAVPSAEIKNFVTETPWIQRDQFPSFKPGPIAQKRLERAQLLELTGLTDLAEGELKFGAHSEGEQNNLYAMRLASYAMQRNAPDDALHDIKLYAPGYLYMPLDQAPLEFWQLAFPMPYRSAIEYYSKQQNLDPYLVSALIRQESDFDPKNVSPANAYGLMQLVPSTGKMLGRHFSLRRVNTTSLMTPDVNIQLGTYYLRTLLDRFNGQMEWVLVAYNAGPSRSELWRNWGPFEETADLIEAIPFHETRLYVQIVSRNAEIYRRLYAGRQPDLPTYQPKPAPRNKRPAKRRKASR